MSALRWLFMQWNILSRVDDEDGYRQTIIVANENDFITVTEIMQKLQYSQATIIGLIVNKKIFN